MQNTASSSNSSSGSNLGINFNGGLPSGGSIGANKASGSSQSITATEQSGIVYSGDNHSLTANNTTNIGGIIANIKTDSDGNQSNGNLNFTTGTLVTKDLVNTATQEQKSIGGSLSTGKTATGVSLNNVGLQLGNTGQDFESVTKATIGQGAVVTSDASTGNDSLAGVNRDELNTEIITKDMQTGGLDVDTGIDTRVFTQAGREEIAKEQRELGKNTKGVAAITGTAGLAVPSIAAGLLDKGNSNPDSLNKSGIDKAKNNVTQLINNLETGMSDNTVNLAATVEAIQEGELTNSVDNKDTLNQLNTAITQGTDAEGTQISLVDDLRDVDGNRVQGTTNVINRTDTYLSTDSMGNVVEVINHDAAHQNGQGEAAADVMGKTGNSAFDLGKWANSGAIAEERTTITPRPITAVNDSKAQQEQLASDKEKLEAQQDAGDAFENEAGYRCTGTGLNMSCSHPSDRYSAQGQAKLIYPNDKNKRDAYIAAHEASKGTGVKNIAKGVIAFATNPDTVATDSVKAIAQLILHPVDSSIAMNNAIVKWQADYEKAKLTNPALAGRMQGELSSILGTEAVIALTTGGAGAVAKTVKVANQASVDVRYNNPQEYREYLAKEAGIPKHINPLKPTNAYGLDSQQLRTYFEINGYHVNSVKEKAKGSGNAQVYAINNHPEIAKIQHSPSTSNLPLKERSQHEGEYIKFELRKAEKDKAGFIRPAVKDAYGNTKIYVIDPKTFVGTAKYSTFYNQQGQRLQYVNGKYKVIK